MLLALTGGETVLVVVAGVFIVFALVVSMLVPRRWPEFPGHRVGLFALVVLILFAGMLTAVVTATGGEEHAGEATHETESGPGETEPAETGIEPAETETEPTETETEPAETETEPTETETGETETTETAPEGGGDAAAGAAVFASAGCGGCHTLAAANASGTVGPNLDEASPSADHVVERVTNGKGAMPSFKSQLSEQQIQDVGAYVSENAGS
jgi:mono/diheme cytochrome c family protein